MLKVNVGWCKTLHQVKVNIVCLFKALKSEFREHSKFHLGLLTAYNLMYFIEISMEIRVRKCWNTMYGLKLHNFSGNDAGTMPSSPLF